MKKFMLALLLVIPLTTANAADDNDAEDNDAIVWTYKYLLATSRTERELAPITDRIKGDDFSYPELTDFAAEVLLARFGDPGFPVQNKIRLIRVLDAAKSQRYQTVLERVRDQAQDPSVSNWARAARRRWIREKDAEYIPGSIDIHAIVVEMNAAARAAKPVTAQGEHLAQFTGSSIEELFEWAGRPQQIVSNQRGFGDGIIRVKVNRIAFFYRGVGRVLFTFGRMERDWVFHSVVADPLAFEGEFDTQDPPALAMAQLVSGYTASMKNAVQVYYWRHGAPPEFTDTAAEILVAQFASTTDPMTLDAFAWICRLLTQYGGHRYDEVLQRVAAGTPDDKLRKFAQLEVRNIDGSAGAYVPGTISLPAQRAKYPSPFPESTFQSGHL